MLAQSFMAAVDLKITEAQRDALIKTLVLMETGKLQYVEVTGKIGSFRKTRKFTGHFNMRSWRDEIKGCGTVACIGGTAEMIGNVDFDHIPDGLYQLFFTMYRRNGDGVIQDITVEQASRALRNYLTTGKPD